MIAALDAARRGLWIAGWPVRMALVGLVRVYRLTLSPALGGQCRYYPSCSVYAEDAIRNRGAVAGSVLAVWRLLRCNPWSHGGVDHAPAARRDGATTRSVPVISASPVAVSPPESGRAYDAVIRERPAVS